MLCCVVITHLTTIIHMWSVVGVRSSCAPSSRCSRPTLGMAVLLSLCVPSGPRGAGTCDDLLLKLTRSDRDRSCVEPRTTLNNGYLGSRIDEERSEMRYVV